MQIRFCFFSKFLRNRAKVTKLNKTDSLLRKMCIWVQQVHFYRSTTKIKYNKKTSLSCCHSFSSLNWKCEETPPENNCSMLLLRSFTYNLLYENFKFLLDGYSILPTLVPRIGHTLKSTSKYGNSNCLGSFGTNQIDRSVF